jgi:hypothetical protein
MESNTRTQSADAQSLDAVFSLLRDRRRRYVVSFLAGRDSPVSLTELATAVTAWELETEPDEVPAERAEPIRTALHHKHLPQLADANVLAYDAEAETVTSKRVEELSPLLKATDGPRT